MLCQLERGFHVTLAHEHKQQSKVSNRRIYGGLCKCNVGIDNKYRHRVEPQKDVLKESYSPLSLKLGDIFCISTCAHACVLVEIGI